MAAKVRANDLFSGLTMLVALALLILVILSMTGSISLCGKRSRVASRRPSARRTQETRAPPAPAPAAGAACGSNMAPLSAQAVPEPQPEPESAPAAGGAQGQMVLLDLEAPQAVEAVRAAGRDKVLYVLGQTSCPACLACKRYLADKGHGDVAVFVDLMSHGSMLKDGSLPRGVAQSLGRGVPCLVAYSHRAGAVMKKAEGFSPKATEEMVAMVKAT